MLPEFVSPELFIARVALNNDMLTLSLEVITHGFVRHVKNRLCDIVIFLLDLLVRVTCYSDYYVIIHLVFSNHFVCCRIDLLFFEITYVISSFQFFFFHNHLFFLCPFSFVVFILLFSFFFSVFNAKIAFVSKGRTFCQNMLDQLSVFVNHRVFLFCITFVFNIQICKQRFDHFRLNVLKFKVWIFAVWTDFCLWTILNSLLAVNAKDLVATLAFFQLNWYLLTN